MPCLEQKEGGRRKQPFWEENNGDKRGRKGVLSRIALFPNGTSTSSYSDAEEEEGNGFCDSFVFSYSFQASHDTLLLGTLKGVEKLLAPTINVLFPALCNQ